MDICRDMLTCILSAQDRNGNEWFQFLPIIIIAALWVLGVILKVVRRRSEQGDERAGEAEEEPVELNLSRLVELARRRYAGAGRPVEQQPKQGRGPAAVPPVIPKKRMPRPGGSRAAVQQSPVQRRPGTQAPQRYAGQQGKETGRKGILAGGEIEWAQPDIAPLSEFSEPTFEDLTAMHKVQTGRQRLTGILEDFSGRDSLKQAILHYEILGKCVAMREPQGSRVWS